MHGGNRRRAVAGGPRRALIFRRAVRLCSGGGLDSIRTLNNTEPWLAQCRSPGRQGGRLRKRGRVLVIARSEVGEAIVIGCSGARTSTRIVKSGPGGAASSGFDSGLTAGGDDEVPYPVLVLLIVGCALFMELLDLTVIATALPAMSRSLHEDPIKLNLAITSYLLSLAVFIPISGWRWIGLVHAPYFVARS